jgi:polyisoprenoid-binding protein YceI
MEQRHMAVSESTQASIKHATYEADPDHSSVAFSARHFGVGTFRGTFSDVAATLVVDDGGPRIEGRAAVESISIRTPEKFREQILAPDFFDAASHPEIRFRSTRLDLDPDGSALLQGELEIKGVAKPLVASGAWRGPIEDPYGLHRLAIDVDAVIDRRDWDMTWQMLLPKGGEQAVGWKVGLEARLELIEITEG